MNNFKSKFYLISALLIGFPSVASELITVHEAEKRYQEIINSKQSNKDKLQELHDLKNLIKASSEIQMLLKPKQNKTPITPKKENEVTTKNSEETNFLISQEEENRKLEQARRMSRIRELSTSYDSGFYLSEYIRIGNDVNANLMINGSSHNNVDINNAIKNKKVFDGYRILAQDSRELTVLNTRTKEVTTVNQRSSEEILNSMAFNQQIAQKYAEAVLMGELEVELKVKTDASKTAQDPLSVTYPTAAMPSPFDSSN
ncbi:hypothetical protein ACTFQF_00035 [Aliivibrio fischeri]|uniref:Uncharacterized protein n=1 Tax=Aliivibrio fischeri (strain MJ11) TaxID=388396 RepID=B5EW56_ALIFM|nr:hypothetical protein [Aliivibrio fischeri]ACH64763.1 hypothetical protein VFMJ11_B0113 [Aliivibrio fischeri MJ11]MUK37618.1 hypothetical protein [Aliivibrio fischeri]